MSRLIYLTSLARKSAWNRRGTLLLVVLSIAISITLLIGIERIRTQLRESFVQAISGTDLVVGARGGDIQLMLYAVFHLGGATNNMSWHSAKQIAEKPGVAWTIPISLGDSHKSYPVVATNNDFFKHYRFRGSHHLTLDQGHELDSLFDVVIGAEAAKALNYQLNDTIVLTHGNNSSLLTDHEDKPFTIVGILKPTGTPVDRSLYINLEAMEAIHLNWQGGAPIPGLNLNAEQLARFNLEPKSITALLVGLERRGQVFALQREVNQWQSEPLMGVMPGVAMDQIWRMVNMGEKALFLISFLVTIMGLASLVSAILAGLNERRRELAILRSTGAKPLDIVILLSFEGVLLTILGTIFGLLFLVLLILLAGPSIADQYGVAIHISAPTGTELLLLAGVWLAGFIASLIPAFRAYRISLSDGLNASI